MKALTATALILTLAACGGSNSDAPVDRFAGLTFGSIDPAEAANGLPYADDETNNNDLIGQQIKTNALSMIVDVETGAATQTAETTVVEFVDGQNFTIRIGEETLTFVNSTATRSNGETVLAFLDFGRDHFGIEIRSTGLDIEELLLGNVVFGFETNPETIAGLTDSTTYRLGLFAGGGAQRNGEPIPERGGFARGLLTLEADFADGSVSGDGNLFLSIGDLTADDSEDLTEVGLTVLPADILGNGFEADVIANDCGSAISCSTDGQLGGIFYGSEAQEVAGLAVFDIEVTDDNGDVIGLELVGQFGPESP